MQVFSEIISDRQQSAKMHYKPLALHFIDQCSKVKALIDAKGKFSRWFRRDHKLRLMRRGNWLRRVGYLSESCYLRLNDGYLDVDLVGKLCRLLGFLWKPSRTSWTGWRRMPGVQGFKALKTTSTIILIASRSSSQTWTFLTKYIQSWIKHNP